MQAPREETKQPAPTPSVRTGPTAAVAAFEEVYVQLAPRLRLIAVRKFGVPFEDAESLVHDVFATYFLHARSVIAVEPYLIGAICNASRYYWRRTGAAAEIFCGEHPCAATPDNALLEEIDRKVTLQRLMGRVGTRCRDLLQRYYVNGETSQAIASAVGLTPGTVKVFLHKCRRTALAAYRSTMEKS